MLGHRHGLWRVSFFYARIEKTYQKNKNDKTGLALTYLSFRALIALPQGIVRNLKAWGRATNDKGGNFMGIVQVTTRPSFYAALEAENREKKSNPETVLTGKLMMKVVVGGLRDPMKRIQQKRIGRVIRSVLKEKGVFTREYNDSDDLGYYTWDGITLHQNEIITDPFPISGIRRFEALMDAFAAEKWYPEDIVLTYYLDGGDLSTAMNLLNILESRRPLIEQALSLQEPMQIIANYGLALGITLSAFSYPAIEAAAFLIAQGCKMALTTGKARMKPCDMSNPKYQMRTGLLRLGFIGEEFERPRKTLLEGLDGDMAFFNEEQKKIAAAKRKAKKLNTPQFA